MKLYFVLLKEKGSYRINNLFNNFSMDSFYNIALIIYDAVLQYIAHRCILSHCTVEYIVHTHTHTTHTYIHTHTCAHTHTHAHTHMQTQSDTLRTYNTYTSLIYTHNACELTHVHTLTIYTSQYMQTYTISSYWCNQLTG